MKKLKKLLTGMLCMMMAGISLAVPNMEAYAASLTSVTIEGTPVVGETLTAVTNPADATVTYQWYTTSGMVSSPIDGATSSTYVIKPEDANKKIMVQVTGPSTYDSPGSVVTSEKIDVTKQPLEVTIEGIPLYGETLTAVIKPTDATVTYQWLKFDNIVQRYSEIEGATNSTYVLKEDEGTNIKVQVTGTGTYAGDTAESSPITVSYKISTVEISGSGHIGGTLTAVTNPGRATATYQWLKDGSSIDGATDSTYVIKPEDLNTDISVKVTGTGTYTGNIIESSTITVESRYVDVSIEGNPYVGETLTAVTDPANATVTYQWLKKKSGSSYYEAIDGATEATYTVKLEDMKSSIKVNVTGSGDYTGSTSTSINTSIKARPFKVKIEGNPYIGETLTVVTDPANATATYKWQYTSGANIGSTGSTYEIKPGDVNKSIWVLVTGTGAYEGNPVYSNYIEVTTRPLEVSIEGTAKVGETLKAVTTPVDATVTYKWDYNMSMDGTSIVNATKSTYVVKPEDAGKDIYVMVAGTGNYAGSYSGSEIVRATAEPTRTPINSVTISGTNKVGETLEVTTDPAEATVDVQWQKSTTKEGPFTDISGATSKSYKLTQDDEGNFIKVVVTGTNAYEGSLTDVTTSAVAASSGSGGGTTGDETASGKLTDSSKNTEYETNDNFADSGYAGTNKMVDVYVTQGAQFTVVIPKKVVLNGFDGSGDYTVKVTGDIPGNQEIEVVPAVSEFTLSTAGKKDITATIEQTKTKFSVADDTMQGLQNGITATGSITAPKLSAGLWTGTFDFNIQVIEPAA